MSGETGFVTSKDGTRIGVRRVGRGPGVVLIQGAMGTIASYEQLAGELSSSFTVLVPDRRGRGSSPRAFDPARASIDQEVEDVEAVLREGDAHLVFGLSSGAIIALEAARVLPRVQRVAVYEPPFHVRERVPRALVRRVHDEIQRGRLAAALVTAGEIVRLDPPWTHLVPRALRELGTAAALAFERWRPDPRYAPLRDLLPAMRFDFRVLEDRGDEAALFGEVKAPALLLGGSASPAYLKDALDALRGILPAAHRVELPGLDHMAPWNADRGGAPQKIAAELRAFFATGASRDVKLPAGGVPG